MSCIVLLISTMMSNLFAMRADLSSPDMKQWQNEYLQVTGFKTLKPNLPIEFFGAKWFPLRPSFSTNDRFSIWHDMLLWGRSRKKWEKNQLFLNTKSFSTNVWIFVQFFSSLFLSRTTYYDSYSELILLMMILPRKIDLKNWPLVYRCITSNILGHRVWDVHRGAVALLQRHDLRPGRRDLLCQGQKEINIINIGTVGLFSPWHIKDFHFLLPEFDCYHNSRDFEKVS